MGLAPNDGLIRPKYPRAANTPFKNDFYNKIGPKRTCNGRRSMSAFGGIVLQKSFCTDDQKFCGLQARLSCKDVRDLIASR
jgi:hypothetical protein